MSKTVAGTVLVGALVLTGCGEGTGGKSASSGERESASAQVKGKTAKEVGEDFRVSATGMGEGYIPHEVVDPEYKDCWVSGTVPDQTIPGRAQVEQVVEALREFGWTPKGPVRASDQRDYRALENGVDITLTSGPWTARVFGGRLDKQGRALNMANGAVEFDASVHGCGRPARGTQKSGAPGDGKRGMEGQRSVTLVEDDLRTALEGLGTRFVPVEQTPHRKSCEVSGMILAPKPVGKADVQRIVDRLRAAGWKPSGTVWSDGDSTAADMEHGRWSATVMASQVPEKAGKPVNAITVHVMGYCGGSGNKNER